MPSCEKCWADAYVRSLCAGTNQASEYLDLVEERGKAGEVCTPEQQAGPDAGLCTACDRRTRHQHTGQCMVCGSKGEDDG